MYKHSTDMTQPPRQASPATPPKEGNVPALYFLQTLLGLLKKCGIVRIQSLAPFGFGFHKLDG